MKVLFCRTAEDLVVHYPLGRRGGLIRPDNKWVLGGKEWASSNMV